MRINFGIISTQIVVGMFLVQTNAFAQSSAFAQTDPSLVDITKAVSNGELILQLKVFPHDNPLENLNVPQGVELDPSQVTLETSDAASCNVWNAGLNAKDKWIKKSARTAWPSGKNITATTVPVAHWVECPDSFTLKRSNGENYSYQAPFIVTLQNDKPVIILLITLEEYLKGVIPSEVLTTWPKESLKAQAIAARTFALWTVFASRFSGQHKYFDMDDTVFYQAYKGIKYFALETNDAVKETAGMVLSNQGRLVKAYFAADAGGFTESAHEVWGGNALPYVMSKKESFEPAPTSFRVKIIQADELSKALSHLFEQMKLYDFSFLGLKYFNEWNFSKTDIVDLSPIEFTASGRVKKVELTYSDATTQVVSGLELRFAAGLRSSLFTVVKNVDDALPVSFTFNTLGFGHGVGLSQIGAKTLADLGWNHYEILKDYYTGVDITSIYAH